MSGDLTDFCSYFQPLVYSTQVIFNRLVQLPFLWRFVKFQFLQYYYSKSLDVNWSKISGQRVIEYYLKSDICDHVCLLVFVSSATLLFYIMIVNQLIIESN